jgi:hypothetical protein
LLVELVSKQGRAPAQIIRKRPFLKLVRPGNESLLAEAMLEEERLEREADRQYWIPLRAELESLSHARLPRVRR